jgi:hypothetical protein
MTIRRSRLTALLILVGAFHAGAGTLSYVAVSPVQSDVNCGIDNRNQYTTAVDGGSASGNDRVINGVRLYSLVGAGPSAAADNCTLNALTGTLVNLQRSNGVPQADGTFAEVLSDMTSNDGASDNSQQEIVLDPASLTAGTTYDLRIYIGNSAAQDREVNLAFVGDDQAPVETGFFNEEDARTSPGAFREPNQVYYIDYRFTWDGASTPGVTVTQKSGQAPFALYALTNQPVIEETAAAPAASAVPVPAAATTALVSAVPDQVGVTSDTFYSNQSLKKHGRWIEVKKYGRCWQPTDSPPDWRPYSRGHFGYSDDGGYVWISDQSENEWGWATYHYGRWCRVPGVGSGWAWVPGTAWSGGWVSWRQGRDREHAFVGWAPLPPEATLRVGVGISTWADREYDIGPDYYTFVNVRDFGSDSYWRPGLIVDRRRYVDILPHTVNITNINYTDTRGNVSNVSITQVRAYNGGPDFTFINTQIRQNGGREMSRIQVNRVGTENFDGGIGSRLQGNTFVVFTPSVTAQPNPRVLPEVAATVPDNKIDHGWADVKDQKLKTQLRNEIAQQTKGQTPETTKAVLPAQVIQAAAQSAATTASPAQSPQAPGVTTIPTASPSASAANQIAGAASSTPPVATSPVQSSPSGAVVNASTTPAASQTPAANKALHPGEKLTSPAVATGRATAPPTGPTPAASGPAVTSALSAETQQSPAPKVLHPGAKVESKPAQSPAVATNVVSPSPTVGVAQSPAGKAQHPGEKIVSAPGQSPAPIRAASPTPSKPAAVTTTQGTPSPAVGLHPGAKIAPTPAQSAAPAVTGTSASPVVPTQSPPRNVQTQRNQLVTPPPTQSPRGAVTAASPSPTAAPTRPVVGRQNQQRGQAETKPSVTPAPSQAQVATTPPQLPATARTPGRAVETVQTPPPVQTPAVTKKVTAPAVTRESTSPAASGPSQQQLQQQQIEERIRQQQQQKQQEQAEQKLQQQQTQQQQQQLQQEQKLKQQELQQKQAQEKAAQAEQKKQQLEQEAAQQKQQQQIEQKKAQQEQAQAEQKRQLQQQKQQQAEQERKLQQQAEQKQLKQQEAAQQKERQAQQLKEQQAQQRQQELKQEQARQKAEQQQQLKQQQLQQQQAEQKQQQLRQQQLQEQQLRQQQMQQQAQQQQRQQQQSQQQNRRAATPTPSPSG